MKQEEPTEHLGEIQVEEVDERIKRLTMVGQ